MPLTKLWRALVFYFEETFDVRRDQGKVSQAKLYEINSAVERNTWYDQKGRRWPERDSI